MAGYIIYNGFWNPDGAPETVNRLKEAAAARGMALTPVPNTGAFADIGTGFVEVAGFCGDDFALFWDKDVRLARAMEATGMRVYNSADAVALCDDKSATHLRLARAGIPMPRTLVAPMTYVDMDAGPSSGFISRASELLGFPMVVKECYGSLGGQVALAETPVMLKNLVRSMHARPFICQQYIRETCGKDVRIYIVGGKPVAAMRRVSRSDFRANIGNGGKGEAYTPSASETNIAATSCRALGLGFAGVDILHGAGGTPLLCEVNASAHMKELERCTETDVAGAVVEYVMKEEGLLK